MYDGKVYAIDVKHPSDYISMLPNKKSEGLLIENKTFYRVLHNGKQYQL